MSTSAGRQISPLERVILEMFYIMCWNLVCFIALHAHASHLHVAVDVQPVVLAGKNNRAVIHQSHIEALSMFHLGLESVDQLAVLGEHCEVEVVVVVSHKDVARGVDAHADGVVGDALASDLSQEGSLVAEDLDAVSAVVADKDLLAVIDNDTIRELKMLGAAKLVENCAHLIEDDDTHDLALNDDDSALVVNGDPAGVLQNGGAKLAYELTILVVDLNLMGGAALGDDDVA